MRSTYKILFISFLVFWAYIFPNPASAFVVLDDGNGHELYWKNFKIPIPYKINAQGTPDTSGEFSAIQHAFKTWEDVPAAAVAFKYKGKTPGSSGAGFDLTNLIVWVESDWQETTGTGSSVIALNTSFYSTIDGQIFDSDIQFNGENFSWSDSGEAGKMDVQNIATHEIGHLIGLDHVDAANYTGPTTYKQATMYALSSAGETKKSTLDADDTDGISYLYPARVSGPTHLSVAGASEPLSSGNSSDITVAVLDIDGAVVADYTGTVRFDSSDSSATLPADYTFVPADNGSHTFPDGFILFATGEQSITVNDKNDTTIAGSQIAITVTDNDTPVANDDTATVAEGALVTVLDSAAASVLANDINANGNPLTAALVSGPAFAASFILNNDGTFSYTHDGSETSSDSFTYRANDGSADSNTATVSIFITPVNDAPVAAPESITVSEGSFVTVLDSAAASVLANDTDAEGDPLTAALVNGPTLAASFTFNADGTFSYAHNGSETTSDSFTYTANDGSAESNMTTISISIIPVNDAPVVGDIANQAISEGAGFTTIHLDDYVSDADHADADINWSVSGNSDLTVSIDALRVAMITIPDENWNGSESITFTATDPGLLSDNDAVTFTVTAVNDVPVIAGQSTLSTLEDSALSISLADLTVIDPDNIYPDDFTLTVQDGVNYTRVGNTVQLAVNFNGELTVPVMVNDGGADSHVFNLSVTVSAVNDAPVAMNGSLTTLEDTAVSATLSANDVEGDTLTFSLASTASKGTVSLTDPNAGAFTYTPDLNAYGTDTFTFRVNDGALNSNTATVSVNIIMVDTDGDGISDADEINIYGTDPYNADTDADGLSDGVELSFWGQNWNADTDSDGVVNILDPDSDGDGFSDGQEFSAGADPATLESVPVKVYEDAEDGTTDRWRLYDSIPAGATISNVYDADRASRVIELSGYGESNGYRLDRADGTPWGNPDQFIIQWSLKYTEFFNVYVDVETTAGHRFMRYEPRDYNRLGAGEYVRHGIGSDVYDGQWHTFVRDLQADLEEAQPGVQVLEVNGFLIRGSGRVDDIQLMKLGWEGDGDGITNFVEVNSYATDPQQSDTDADGISDSDELDIYMTDPNLADTDGDGINDGDELNYWGVDWDTDIDSDGLPELSDEDADNDGAYDGAEVDQGYDPRDPASTPVTVYEDAEDGTTDGWYVYDNRPSGAVISNVYDVDRASRVIEFSGFGDHNGYRLDRADGTPWGNPGQFVIQWSLKYAEYFVVYVELETTAGRRFIRYEPRNYNRLGAGEYVRHGIGSDVYDGQWRTFVRDLQADLEEAQPGVSILEVNAFLIRGSGRVDDIQLMKLGWEGDGDGITNFAEVNSYATDPQQSDTDADGISDSDELDIYMTDPNRADTDEDGLDDGDELNYWGADWDTDIDSDGLPELSDEDADNDGAFDGAEVDQGYDPRDPASTPVTVYEDAEDGTTDGWYVYDNRPSGAVISNVYDDDRASRVIEFSGFGDHNGYRLDRADGTPWGNPGQFVIQWSLKYAEYFVVYVELETTAGSCFIRYEPRNYNRLGAGEYVRHGIGSDVYDGQWHTFVRDLQADLNEAQPGVQVLEVNGFLIRGSGRVDDIILKSTE